MRHKSGMGVWVVAAMLLAGCVSTPKQQTSTGIGAALGAVVGGQLGTGRNRILGIAAGAAIGGLIGNKIGKHLDEQDKQRAAEASARTAQTGQVQRVKTKGGATVTTAPVSPVAQGSPPTAAPPTTQTSATPECKTVRQTIVLQNGVSESEDVTMCRGPDGGWKVA